jgi:hypothetical protein
MKTIKRAVLWLSCLVALGGCSVVEFQAKSEAVAEEVKRVTVTIPKAADTAEPAVVVVETAAGGFMTQEQQDSGVAIATTAEKVAQTAAGVAALIPGGQGIAAILAALVPFAGFLGRWIGRRKVKSVAKAAVRAADEHQGGGTTMQAMAAQEGVTQEIKAALREVRADEA